MVPINSGLKPKFGLKFVLKQIRNCTPAASLLISIRFKPNFDLKLSKALL